MVEDDGGAPEQRATASLRPRLRVRFLAGGLALAAGLYLALTFAAPRTVPRLAFLPEPPSRIWYDECNGEPLNQHVEAWERRGGIWVRAEFSTLAGCPDDMP